MRAREPDRSGFAVRAGVRLYYEVHGDGPSTVVLLPTWSIVDSRTWKLQVPYLARHARVVVADPRGNGRSDRPVGPSAYDDAELVADALAVMDAADVTEAVVVGLSCGARVLLDLATSYADRVSGAVFVAPDVSVRDRVDRVAEAFEVERNGYHGWEQWNAHFWRQDLQGFAEFFFDRVFPEPHSTRQIEEGVAWALGTDAETLVATQSSCRRPAAQVRDLAGKVRCPSLVVHGDTDRNVSLARGRAFAEALGAPLEVVAGGGHCVQARHPVWFNLRLRRFVEEVSGRAGA